MGKETADLLSTFAMSLEFPGARKQAALVVENRRVGFKWWLFAAIFFKLWFWIKGIDLGNPAIHIEENNALCLRFKM
jgi:hypothetical protein